MREREREREREILATMMWCIICMPPKEVLLFSSVHCFLLLAIPEVEPAFLSDQVHIGKASCQVHLARNTWECEGEVCSVQSTSENEDLIDTDVVMVT